jgi:hypothetical protein
VDSCGRERCLPGLSAKIIRTHDRNRYTSSATVNKAVFIVTVVLFLLPCSLILAAWRRYIRSAAEAAAPNWRTHCGKAALILAVCSMLLELVFYYSWFHNGGSPHGMMPSPGIWKFVGRIAFWTFAVSLVFAAFGKGKWRIFIPVWALAYAFAVYMIFMLEMD